MLQELTDFIKNRCKGNLLIVAANIAVFLWITVMGGDSLDSGYMLQHGAMLPAAVTRQGEYYRLFTSMFLHFGAEHLLFNMLLLLFAGDMLQARTGLIRYLIIYLGGGLAGNLLSLAVNLQHGTEIVSAGASGAIFAVIGGLVWLVLKNDNRVPEINGQGVLMMAILSLVQGFMDTGVDNYAHLGGFIGGFLLAAITGIPSDLFGKRR